MLNRKLNQIDDNFLSFGEEFNANGGGWTEHYSDGFNAGDFYAGGDDPYAGVDTSRPYQFTLTNTTGSSLSNVSFLKAYTSIGATNDGVTAGVTCTFDNGGISYAQFLQQLTNMTVKIGLVYMECSTTSQLTTPFSIGYTNMLGDSSTKSIPPTIDPRQNQTTVITVKVGFILNQFVQLIFSSLVTTNALKLRLYPTLEYNESSELSGKGAMKNFGNPNIERPTVMIQK
jgi:hypothetical protein